MKFTQSFLYTRQREDRRDIRIEWIERVATHPEREQVQADGRIRRWGRIAEAGGKWLRVVLLEDGETVHNAFFDRSVREAEDES
jgi:pyrroloquinoline quinone (PQQ) biosynthesis protein C